ncbi:hypothetical protein I316_07265 [Kwoniella heveanensis BCC8398]|uniref:Uncharacterized protein n=1 Tax=Kwoniella heveanensis BCC8398 TaxID=1296120 RepID=A0A1B9GJI6_9TREE|nr:hypothetical protein I316_07265 [Kwoniella heveanensis BCC8398]
MLETVVGQLLARRLEYSYSDTPFIDTVIISNSNTNPGSAACRSSHESSHQRRHVFGRQGQRSTDRDRNKERFNSREDLEGEHNSAEEQEDLDSDMAELSDSRSSVHTSSRPVTPSNPIPHPGAIHILRGGSSHTSKPSNSGSLSNNSPPGNGSGPAGAGEGVFTLAHKAEKILGLVPGTLGHARACLENARDEVRRTADSKSPTPEPLLPGYSFSGSNPTTSANAKTNNNGHAHGHANSNSTGSATAPAPAPGMRDRIQTRARKAMSVAGFPGYSSHSHSSSHDSGSSKMNGVVLGIGGREEEERRERRRKAADGVIYWQREVARLEEEAEAAMAAHGRR